ncbi:unnamed protein product, partial [marine sediment metagenome]
LKKNQYFCKIKELNKLFNSFKKFKLKIKKN